MLGESVRHGKRALANFLNSNFNRVKLPRQKGSVVVSLNVPQGNEVRACSEVITPCHTARLYKFFKSDMGMFKDTSKKQDAGGVRLVKGHPGFRQKALILHGWALLRGCGAYFWILIVCRTGFFHGSEH